MTQNTAQSEALQAVRLLRGAALSSHGEPKTQAYIETLYQACKLLEGFIENHQALELSTDDEDMTYQSANDNTDSISHIDGHLTWQRGNSTFRLQEHIYVDDIGTTGTITKLEKNETEPVRIVLELDIGKNVSTAGTVWGMTGNDVSRMNPKGSWK